MKVLFSCLPGLGHFHPLLPLARDLTGTGHEVAFATAERFCRRVVVPAGFEAFPAGLSPVEVGEEMQRRYAADDGGSINPDPAVREAEVGARMFAGVAGPAKAADLTEIVATWKPSVVVHDALDFGAPVTAAQFGLPWASHSFGALQRPELWERAGELMRPTWRAHGVEPGPAGGTFRYLYLDICPPSLQAPHIADITVAHRLRPVVSDGIGETLPAWVHQLGSNPTVYVTLGTVFNHTVGLFETVLAALATEALNVIVTVGRDRDPAELGVQPDHIRVERYLPQSLLLPRCDLVVCHGGSGTTLAALAHGLPLLILPMGADQHGNGSRSQDLGAALTLQPEVVTPVSVRQAVLELLGQPGYRAAAGRVKAEIEAMPGPRVAVGLLERLAQHRRPVA
jgi:UDP:flavonoid glycosyltransferase YjiC (YdhE family)